MRLAMALSLPGSQYDDDAPNQDRIVLECDGCTIQLGQFTVVEAWTWPPSRCLPAPVRRHSY